MGRQGAYTEENFMGDRLQWEQVYYFVLTSVGNLLFSMQTVVLSVYISLKHAVK